MEISSPVNHTTTSTASGTGNWYTAAPGGGTGRGPSGVAPPGHAATTDLNRQVRRTKAKARNAQFFGGLKHPKTPTQQELGRRIQAKLKGKESGGEEIGRAATQSMVEMIRDSLGGLYATLNNYWPAFPGASAEQTCDAQGTNCVNPWPTIDELREFANGLGYAMRVSPSAKARKDQSLKGVAVIIADHGHYDPVVQGEISRFVDWPKPGNKFKLLVELPADDPDLGYCMSHFNRADCIQIDDVANPQRDRAQALHAQAFRRFLNILAADGVAAAQKMLADRSEDLSGQIGTIVQLSKSGMLNKRQQDEKEIYFAALGQYYEFVQSNFERREKAMLAGLDEHLDAETGFFETLGATHVKNLLDELLKRTTVILTRRSNLAKDELHTFDDSAKAKAH